MRFDVEMGEKPGRSFIDVSGQALVVPDSAKSLPPDKQATSPGFFKWKIDNLGIWAQLLVTSGTVGRIRLELNVKYGGLVFPPDTSSSLDGIWDYIPFPKKDPPPFPHHGTVSCAGAWHYSVTKTGELTVGQNDLTHSEKSDDFQVRIENPQFVAATKTHPPFLSMDPIAIYDGVGTKARHNLPIVKAILIVIGMEAPQPDRTPSVPTPSVDLLNRTVHFEKENQSRLDGNVQYANTLRALDDWVERVEKEAPLLLKAINKKFVMVHVTGFASPPGSYELNSDLSEARALYVQERIARAFGTESVRINRRARGERQSQEVPGTPRSQNDSVYLNDRRVEIRIDPAEAKSGMERVLKTGG